MAKKLFLPLLFFTSFLSYSQTSKSNVAIEQLKNDVDLKHASWSVYAMNSTSSKIIADYNSHLSLVPASTLKIATTGAALGILGNNFVFETKLEYDGVLDAATGYLKGNLYITGGGDPSLQSHYFNNKADTVTVVEKWAEILKKAGIKKIDGAIIGDASIFENNATPAEWIWGDMGNYFGAAASGLSYMDNKYAIDFRSGEAGKTTTVKGIRPAIQDMQLINKVVAGGKTDSAFVYGAPYSYYRIAEGTIPANQKSYEIEGAMPDPALFCATALQDALKNIGVSSTAKATTVRALTDAHAYVPAKRTTLYTHPSPSLDKIVYWTNFKSLNLYAEHLLKYLGYKKNGITNGAGVTKAVTEYWKNKGVDVSGFFMYDGCGLARANNMTTKTQTQMLQVLANDKNFGIFYNSLPIAGKQGPLANFCDGSIAENNLRAKSGYLTRVRGYAGYVKNKKGELLCFSILVNNYGCTPSAMKKKLEKLLITIAETE